MEYGIQLFGAREFFKADPRNFFETVSRMGYGYIEPCLAADFLPPQMTSTLWTVDETAGYIKMMDEAGLSIISCHAFGLEERMVELRERFGIPRFVVHVGDAAADFNRRLDEIGELSEKLRAAGAELWLHNGEGDCVPGKAGELSYYEALLKGAPYVKAELDNGWAIMDGVDQYALMEALGDSLGCLHLKEMACGLESLPMERRFAVPGEGVSDFARLLALNGARPIILDEDYPVRDWFDDFEKTINALRAF